jgi:hypothetical protein
MGSKALKKVSSFVLPKLGAAGGFANGLINGQGVGGALKGGLRSGIEAAGSIAGAQLAGNIFPTTIGNVLGKSAGNALGSTIANTSIGSAIGSYAGNALGGSYADSIIPQDDMSTDQEAPTPFSPTRQAQLEAPNSLSGFSSLTPDQVSSNLATQGVYGGGLGPEEQGYFTNMINRKLVDDAGNVDSNLNDVSDIEKSYLSQLGLSGYGNPRDLLEALSKWKAQ